MMGLSEDKVFTGNVGQASKSICPFMFCFLCGKRNWGGHMVFKNKSYFLYRSLLPGGTRWLLPGQEGISGNDPEKPLRASCRNNWCTFFFFCHFTSPFAMWWLDPHLSLMLEEQQTRAFQGVCWSEVQLELFYKLHRTSGCFRVFCS